MLDAGFYLMDCMAGMAQFPDKFFELAIVDPPYGLGASVVNSGGRFERYTNKNGNWDTEVPTKEYFDELRRVSKEQIVWGGNYFDLPPTKCFVIWDKRQPENVSFASCEFAWTSFDRVAKTFYFRPQGQEFRFHPTQKPIALYKWLLTNYAHPGDKILDTHVGSASSLIACHQLGFQYWGFELDADYYKAASDRLARAKAQVGLLDILPQNGEQLSL
jgi:site-specific DNA-methyltransferase (adenine-specific)